MRPFRFGLNLWSADSRQIWQDKARKLEVLGYATLLVPDHLGSSVSPLAALVSAADVTRTLRVGTNVLNNDFYHPVLLAREAATVDLLSDGRLELGTGAGYMESEYRAAGLQYDAGSTRVDRLAECISILKRLFAGERLTFAGRHFRVTEHELKPAPVQRPHPPLLVGGDGQRILELAAREAEIIGLTGLRFRSGAPPADVSSFRAEAVDVRVNWLRAVAGQRFDDLELSALVQRVVVTDNRRTVAEELAAVWPALSPEDVLQSPYLLIGTLDELVEDVQRRRERWGISYIISFEPFMDTLAPVVARLAGN